MTINEKIANFIVDTRWETLPEAVQDQIRRCMVDDLGAALSGTLARVSQITSDYAAATWPGDEATILLQGKRAGAVGAAFANAWSANAFDSDDGLRYAYGHAGAQILPAALAVAESRDLDGGRLLAGMAVGYEVAHRVGRCWHDSRDVYQACGSWGSVACAAAAANLVDLTPDQAWQALGIAEYHAPNAPMMRDVDDPAMVKHAIGWGAMTGVVSVGLAAEGFTGIPSIMGFERYGDWVSDIGETYIVTDGVMWKEKGYACCGWAHAAARGAKELVDQHDVALDAIDVVRVEGPDDMVRLGASLPSTTEEAQFNVAWPVAAMLVDGEIGPEQTLEARLDDLEMRRVARKVRLEETDEMNRLCRLYEQGDPEGCFASRATLVLRDGTVLESGLVEGSARFPNPGWSRERMDRKFRWLVGFVLDDERIDDVAEMAWHLQDVPSVRHLTDLVSG